MQCKIYISYDELDVKIYREQILKVVEKLKENKSLRFWLPVHRDSLIGKQPTEEEVEENDVDRSQLSNDSNEQERNEGEDGFITDEMIAELNSASLVLIIITKNYQTRVNSSEPFDSCRYEYVQTLRKKKMLIPLIFDEEMRDSSLWEDRFGSGLLDYLSLDFTIPSVSISNSVSNAVTTFSETRAQNATRIWDGKCQLLMNCINKLLFLNTDTSESKSNNDQIEDSTIKTLREGVAFVNEVLSNELNASESCDLCPIHLQHRYQLYDTDCRRPICLLCHATEHQGHNCTTIPTIIQYLKQERHVPNSNSLSKHIYQTESRIKQLNNQLAALEEDRQKQIRQLQDQFQLFQQQIQEKHLSLKATFEEDANIQKSLLTNQLQVLLEIKKTLGKHLSEQEIHYHVSSSFSQSIKYLFAALQVEDDLKEIEERKRPYDMIVPLQTIENKRRVSIFDPLVPTAEKVEEKVFLPTPINPKESLYFLNRIQSLGNQINLAEKIAELFQRHQQLIKFLQTEVLQLPANFSISYQAPLEHNFPSMIESYESYQKAKLIEEENHKKRYKDTDRSHDSQENNFLFATDSEFSIVDYIEIVYVKFLQELILWLISELSLPPSITLPSPRIQSQEDKAKSLRTRKPPTPPPSILPLPASPSSRLLVALQLLWLNNRSISISPLQSNDITYTVRNSEVYLHPDSCSLNIRFKQFPVDHQLQLDYDDKFLMKQMIAMLFPQSRILSPIKDAELVLSLMEMLPLSTSPPGSIQAPFQLLYRGSENGMMIDTIKRSIHCQSHIIILMKCLDGNVFGGYTSVGWKGVVNFSGAGSMEEKSNPLSSFNYDDEAFLFSLKNPFDIPPIKFPVAQAEFAVKEDLEGRYGFIFGQTLDMYLDQNFLVYFHHLQTYHHPLMNNTYRGSEMIINIPSFLKYNHIGVNTGQGGNNKGNLIFTGKYTGNSLVELEVWKIAR